MDKRDIVVQKIMQLRRDYSDKYLETHAIRSGKAFDLVHDKVVKEINDFKQTHNIAIDPHIVFVSKSDFEKYVDSGVIREFIVNGDLNVL